MDEFDIANKIKSRALIIPGKVAVMKGEIQDKLPEWSVIVAPNEAVQLVKYMRDEEWKKSYVEEGSRRCRALPPPPPSPLPPPRRSSPRLPSWSRAAYMLEDKVVTYGGHDPASKKFVGHRRAHPLHLPGHPQGHGHL